MGSNDTITWLMGVAWRQSGKSITETGSEWVSGNFVRQESGRSRLFQPIVIVVCSF